jgi:chorismate mutase
VRLLAKIVSVGFAGSVAMIPAAASSPAQVQLPAPAQVQDVSAPAAMIALVGVMARRVAIGDTVAAAKWGTTLPIEDPAREKTVTDNAAAQAPGYGLDPGRAARIFSDQIAANKVVQYGLFSRWTAHPGQAPAQRPDLATVRPVLDAITGELLAGLRATGGLRAAGQCRWQVHVATVQVAHGNDFDPLHREALERAGTSSCG